MGNLITDNLGATKPVSTNQLSTDVERVRAAFDTFDAAIQAHQTNTANPHNTTAAQVGAIPDGSAVVNDTRLGSRTADVGNVPTTSSGTLTQWVSWMANRFRAITGTVNWYDAPATTLSDAKSHMDATGNPHGTTAAQVGAIPSSNNAVTDVLVGARTVDQALASPANTGTLTQLVSWLAGRIRAISGATSWTDTPATTLAVAAAHIANTSNPHATTAAQVGAPTTSGAGALGTWGISISGNAATATALQTPRTINGVSFNGSSNITVSAQATNTSTQLLGLGVGTAASAVAGEIRATNNVTAYYSDQRLKTIFGEITDALGKVDRMSGIYFQNNDLAESFGYTDKSQQVGVIAQQVKAEVPEAVRPAPFDTAFTENGEGYSISGDEYLTVQYEKLVPVLIQAIKELNARVKLLEK
jgi:hypothetical protein